MRFEFEFPKADCCRRCKKDFAAGDKAVPAIKTARGRKSCEYVNGHLQWTGEKWFRENDVMLMAAWYHKKCLPPNMLKRLSGLASPDSSSSLRNEHEEFGGVS